MSLSLDNLNLIQTVDPRINVERLKKLEYAVETCGQFNSYNVVPITNLSSSGFSVSANPPSRNVFIDRKFYLLMSFTLTFVGTSAGAGVTLLQTAGLLNATGVSAAGNTAYYDCPRAYALSNALSNIQISLNGDTISTNLNEYIRALTRYKNEVAMCQDRFSSMLPSMLDQSVNYSDLNGFARDPMRGYGDNFYQTPRGGYWGALVTRNDSTGAPGDIATVVLNVIEPIYLSPLDPSCSGERPNFYGIDTINLVGTFNGRGNTAAGSLISALWSHKQLPAPAVQSVFSSFNVVVNNGAALFQYITPDLSMVPKIPRSLVYDYVNPIFYSTTSNTSVAAGAPVTLNLQNVQLNSVPDRMYVWVSNRDQDVTLYNTDTYWPLGASLPVTNLSVNGGLVQNALNITFNNQTGILSTATNFDLYQIAAKNGCNGNFNQFSSGVSTVLSLKFGEDINLPNLVSAGSRGSYNISLQLQVVNPYTTTQIPSINVVFMNTGTYTIQDGQNLRNTGILTENDVLKTGIMQEIPMNQPKAMDALGGLNWGDILNFFKKGARTALNVGKIAAPLLGPEFVPGISIADQIARSVGVGKMRGGKKLTRAEMMKRLR